MKRHALRALFVARRALALGLVVVVATSLAFLALAALPGDPARALVGPQASAADVARARAAYALDAPLGARYVAFWRRLVHLGPAPAPGAKPAVGHAGPAPAPGAKPAVGHASCSVLAGPVHVDLGTSFHHRKPVAALLAERFPRTLELACAALAVQLALGLAIGVLVATRRRAWSGQAASSGVTVVLAAPSFIVGLALQYALSYRLGLLPLDGFGRTPAEHAASLVLPALTLGLFGAAFYARLVEGELGAALERDHARAARARGASRRVVVVRHGLRLVIGPVAALAVLDLGALAGGAVVTERLFRWPGVGQLAVDALVARDGPLILGSVLLSATAVAALTLALDATYALLDPRAR